MIVMEEVYALQLRGDQMSQKWDERFLGIARSISTWSKDPSTKVGAIAIQDRRIVAQGYNGFPCGSKDLPSDYDNREIKYKNIIHAEVNVIYNACNSGVSLKRATIFVFGTYPCFECVKALAQVGVVRVVFQLGISHNAEKWKDDFEISKLILHSHGIGFTHYFEDYQKTPYEIAHDITGYYALPVIGDEENSHYLPDQTRADLMEKIESAIRHERKI